MNNVSNRRISDVSISSSSSESLFPLKLILSVDSLLALLDVSRVSSPTLADSCPVYRISNLSVSINSFSLRGSTLLNLSIGYLREK